MPVFSFPYRTKELGHTLEESGSIIPVTVGIPAALEEFYVERAYQVPPAVSGYALVDTGASASAAHEPLLLDLGVLPIDSIPTMTPHGAGRSFVYPAKVAFPAMNVENYRMDRLVGSQLNWETTEGKRIIMLLGRDILRHMLLVYNGVSADVHLAF